MDKCKRMFNRLICEKGYNEEYGEPYGAGNDFEFSEEGMTKFKEAFEDSEWDFDVTGWTEDYENPGPDSYHEENLRSKIIFDNTDGGTKYTMKIKFNKQIYNYKGNVYIDPETIKIGPFKLKTYNLLDDDYDWDENMATLKFDVGLGSSIYDKDKKYVCALHGLVTIKIPANVFY